ncbi:MAG: HAD-IIB family hydrolase [Oscillospiraceae bacterium]|nr:HAD-IIB family hydrolase [Oscillospiraceae bacterium]
MGLFSDVLLTVDYDRTLTAPDSTIPMRNLEAIRWFIDNGGVFTVNSGRSLPMTKVFRDIVPVNAPLLLYNGSAAYDLKEKRMIFMHVIGMDQAQTVRELMADYPDLTVEVQGIDAHYNFIPDPMFDAFSENQDCAFALAEPDQDLGPFLKFTLYGEFRDNTMAHMYEGSAADIARIDAVQEQLCRRYGDKVEVFRAAPRIIDVQTKGVSKLRSARELQQHLGRKILVCAGDGENDVPMLTGADFAFTPADAVVAERFPNVCKCADGAVADVIYEKIPRILNLDLDKRG